MKAIITGDRLHRLAANLNADEDPLMLEPIRSEPVFVIRPIGAGLAAKDSRAPHDRRKREFIKRKYALPFRGAAQGNHRVG
jgi:hypothetical protein